MMTKSGNAEMTTGKKPLLQAENQEPSDTRSTEADSIDDLFDYLSEDGSWSPYTGRRIFLLILRQAWDVALATVGFIELLAFILPALFLKDGIEDDGDGSDDEIARGSRRSFLFGRKKEQLFEDVDRYVASGGGGDGAALLGFFVRLLDENRYEIGIFFCVLWLVDAFVHASSAREGAMLRWDREWFLALCETADDDSKKEVDSIEDRNPVKDGGETKTAPSTEFKKSDDYFKGFFVPDVPRGGWGVYIVMVAIYMSLLPVGFYLLTYIEMKAVVFGQDLNAEVAAVIEDDVFPEAPIDIHEQYCLGYALVLYFYEISSRLIGVVFKRKRGAGKKKIVRRIVISAIRHPLRFRRRLKKALRAVRWAKYLAPLIGTGNKLMGNIVDLLKKYKQALEAKNALRVRMRLWHKMTKEERRERAVIVIQRNYRAMRARRARKALSLFVQRKEHAAALRVQSVLRGMMARAKARLRKKRMELLKLQARQMEMRRLRREQMSTEERMRMYKLESELNVKAKRDKERRMLLRPNTKFAVTWKVAFVVCVVLEITQLSLNPKLAKYTDKETGMKMSTGDILERKLVPILVSEREECGSLKRKPAPEKRKLVRIFSPLQNIFRRNNQHGRGDEHNSLERNASGPWYCHPRCATAQSLYISTVRLLIREGLFLMSGVMFLDVFITFFTGEIRETDGALVPKPFFTRWILPGLMLQLAVNPKMEEVSLALHWCVQAIHSIGPTRFVRWCVVLIVPVVSALLGWFERSIWTRFVRNENATKVAGAIGLSFT